MRPRERQFLSRGSSTAPGVCYFGWVIYSLIILLISSPSHAQWKPLFKNASGFKSIYFMDLPGPPRIGFAGDEGTVLYKTIDGGKTWKLIRPAGQYAPIGICDFSFKDSITGWLAGSSAGGCYKTMDGGDTWTYLPGSRSDAVGVHYAATSNLLLVSAWRYILSSPDEGKSWSTSSPSITGTGFAFTDSQVGVVASAGGAVWSRTEDGGTNWTVLNNTDSESWQPLAIPTTKTQFAISDRTASVFRTDDLWDNWKKTSTFPLDPDITGCSSSGCVCGDFCHLFVQLRSGCYMSSDEGTSWNYLNGPPFGSKATIVDRRFYVKDNLIYMATLDASGGTIWMLDLDSVDVIPIGLSERLSDGSKKLTTHPGDSVTLNFIPGAGTMTMFDSVKLSLRYDPNSLDSLRLTLPIGWWVSDSASHDGVLDVMLRDSLPSPLPSPLLQVTFKTYLSRSSTKIYLDSFEVYRPSLSKCDYSSLSVSGPDSVEIGFEGCGDSTLQLFMASGSIIIEGVQPNPLSSTTTLKLSSRESASSQITIHNLLGTEVARLFSGELGAGEHTFTWDARGMPPGMYECVVRMNGRVERVPMMVVR